MWQGFYTIIHGENLQKSKGGIIWLSVSNSKSFSHYGEWHWSGNEWLEALDPDESHCRNSGERW